MRLELIMNYGKTNVLISKDEFELGSKVALDVAIKIRELLEVKNELRIVFAAGESQMTFLNALAEEKNIDWQRIVCFNLDDFHDVNMPEKFTCGFQTSQQLYNKVKPKQVYLVKYNASDPQEEAERFEKLLREEDLDILCQGIGTSGHLALNEPFDTDFKDEEWVKVVDLAKQSKIQLMDDPNFKDLGYIPLKGITMTIPALFSAANIYTIVPLGLKRPILEKLFKTAAITNELPASILLEYEGTLYVDTNSCPECLN
ncbi:MAG: hypothetical protein COA79_12415 [Planctomycetota bacterium]|nr:MAG: hypothetical protein COA79_12415 [Planctomycetota bacterium]